MQSAKKEEQDQFEVLIQGLLNDKYGCSDGFIKESTILGLRNNIQNIYGTGNMQVAGLGNDPVNIKNSKIRGDKIRWIEKKSKDQFEIIFLKKVGNFINYLNKTCYTSISDFESHYANFEQQSFYKRHLDQFKTDHGRKYSMIVYLNEDWQKEDGGMLSLYPEGSEQKDISPIGGRVVFFRSDEMEHEVQPSFTRNRISIAGWFKS